MSSTDSADSSTARAAGLRIVPVYAALFCAIGLALPYWPTWLESRGLAPELIGVLLGIGPWVRFGLNPAVGRFADRHQIAHRLIAVGGGLLVLSYLCMYLAGSSVVMIAALMVVGAVGFGPLVPLTDSVVLRAKGVDYGRLRAWGSLAFILASFGGGLLLDRHGADAIVVALVASASVIVVASVLLPAPRSAKKQTAESRGAGAEAKRQASAWKTPGFAAFIVTVALLNGSHAMLYGFATLHWRAIGISEANVGVLWSVSVVAEIVLFMLGKRLRARLGSHGLLALAAGGGVLRWSLLATSPSFAVLLGTQTLHALTFAAMHLGVMDFVQTRVKAEATAHATSLYSAIATGVALGILMPLSGLLYARFEGAAFAFMIALSGLALFGALVGRRLAPKL